MTQRVIATIKSAIKSRKKPTYLNSNDIRDIIIKEEIQTSILIGKVERKIDELNILITETESQCKKEN